MSSKAQQEVSKNKRTLLIKEMVKRTAPYKLVFKGTNGEAILKDLKAEFRKLSVVAATPHETTIRAAQYDVLDYIEKMINFKGEEDEIHESKV